MDSIVENCQKQEMLLKLLLRKLLKALQLLSLDIMEKYIAEVYIFQNLPSLGMDIYQIESRLLKLEMSTR